VDCFVEITDCAHEGRDISAHFEELDSGCRWLLGALQIPPEPLPPARHRWSLGVSCDAGKMRWVKGVAGEEEWGEARRFPDSKNEGHAGAVDHVLHHMQRLRSAHPPSAFIRRRATFTRTMPSSPGMKENKGVRVGALTGAAARRERERHAQRPSPVQQRARKGTDKEELPEEGASGGNLHAPHHPVYGTAMPAFAIGGVVDTHA
jgi:hypothetical protein